MIARVQGVVLVACKGGEYWFIDSVFRHNFDLYGCTGAIVWPVSADQVEDGLSIDQLEERFGNVWEELAGNQISADCDDCVMGPREEGCEFCNYQSLHEFCKNTVQYSGCNAIFDYPGSQHKEALRELPELRGKVETINCTGWGRIFRCARMGDFDKVYNSPALAACLDYEAGRVSYDSAIQHIFA